MANSKPIMVRKKKNKSRRKNLLVTLIAFGSFDAAFRLRNITTVVMNNAEPVRADTVRRMSDLSPPPAAEMAAKTSGAPFPSASKVTPARDSEKCKRSEMCSKAGDRYKSAVEPKLYMAIAKNKNKTGKKNHFLPDEQNVDSNPQ